MVVARHVREHRCAILGGGARARSDGGHGEWVVFASSASGTRDFGSAVKRGYTKLLCRVGWSGVGCLDESCRVVVFDGVWRGPGGGARDTLGSTSMRSERIADWCRRRDCKQDLCWGHGAEAIDRLPIHMRYMVLETADACRLHCRT